MPQKLSHESDPKHVPDVVYVSPMEMKPNRVALGLLVGAIVIAIGIGGAYIITNLVLTDTIPTPSVDIKKAPPSAKIATPSIQKDETAGWKIYKDNFYNISYAYPENWEEKTKEEEVMACKVSVGPKDVPTSGLTICEFGQSSAEELANTPNETSISMKKTLTVSGKMVIRQVVTENNKETVYAYVDEVDFNGQKGTLTVIGWPQDSGLTTEEFINIFDLIISTFQFLE